MVFNKPLSSEVHKTLLALNLPQIPKSLEAFVAMLDNCVIERGEGLKLAGRHLEFIEGQRFEALSSLLNLLDIGRENYYFILGLSCEERDRDWKLKKFNYRPADYLPVRKEYLKRYFNISS